MNSINIEREYLYKNKPLGLINVLEKSYPAHERENETLK